MFGEVRAALLPRRITKAQVYKLCRQHGKLIVILELRDRHGVAVKDGNTSEAIELRHTILQLERLTEAEIANRLTSLPRLVMHRITPEPTREEVRERRNREALTWVESRPEESDGVDGADEVSEEDDAPRYGDLFPVENSGDYEDL